MPICTPPPRHRRLVKQKVDTNTRERDGERRGYLELFLAVRTKDVCTQVRLRADWDAVLEVYCAERRVHHFPEAAARLELIQLLHTLPCVSWRGKSSLQEIKAEED